MSDKTFDQLVAAVAQAREDVDRAVERRRRTWDAAYAAKPKSMSLADFVDLVHQREEAMQPKAVAADGQEETGGS